MFCWLRQAAETAMDQAFIVQLPLPWVREAPMTRELLVDGAINGKSRFHYLDAWHCVHLGVGKTWAACGVMMLQALLPESNMEARIANIAQEYKGFCWRMHLDPIIRKIDVHTFGGTTDPVGTWSKAAVTSNFLMFIEEFCDKHSEHIQRDERLRVFVSLPCIHQLVSCLLCACLCVL